MYRINYILLFMFFVVQQSIAASLSDIENINKSKLIPIEAKKIEKALKNLPSSKMIAMQTFLKESKKTIKLTLPLLLAAISEMYLSYNYNKNIIDKNGVKQLSHENDYEQEKPNYILSYLPLFLMSDVMLSSSYIANKRLHEYFSIPISLFLDIYCNGVAFIFLALFSSCLPDVPLSKIITLYALIGGFFNIKNRVQERIDTLDRAEEYQNNINNLLQQIPIDKYFDRASNIFLYINDKDTNVYCSEIEDFYKWIILHKNDICLYNLISFTEDAKNIDKHSIKKELDQANCYQLKAINDKIIHYKKFKLEFILIEKNKKLTQELLIRSLENPGIKLIEVDKEDTKNKSIYKYVALINDSKNYYLVFAIELNNEITKFPKTYRQIIYKSIFNNDDNYLETSTLVVKFDSIDKIKSIMEYLFLYLGINYHTCVYDVLLNNHLSQKVE